MLVLVILCHRAWQFKLLRHQNWLKSQLLPIFDKKGCSTFTLENMQQTVKICKLLSLLVALYFSYQPNNFHVVVENRVQTISCLQRVHVGGQLPGRV